MKIQVAQLSHIGMHRSENQDSMNYVNPEDKELLKTRGCLLMVADGMGGAAGGRVASQIASSVVPKAYYANSADPLESLRHAFQAANQEILQRSQADSSLQGMGTTATAIAFLAGKCFFAHVGDTRLYRVRGHQIQQLTKDHSMVATMVREGLISEVDARHHPQRNILLRSVGVKEEIAIDVQSEEVKKGDVYVLCTDGLHGLVEDQEIATIVEEEIPEMACESLVTFANQRGGFDNVTIQVAVVDSLD
jgi:protein phosphatase